MKPALLAEEISGYFYHLHQCTCARRGRKRRFIGTSVGYSFREVAESNFFSAKSTLFLSKSPKNKTAALRFASEHEGKRAEMSGKWWRLNAKALMMGKSSGVHYHHVRCETLVYSEMMSVCKQEVALRVCVCLHMSTDGWVDQAVFVFTVHRLNMMRYFTYFIHGRHRYTGNAIVLERKPWKTAIVCSSRVSPKVLWVILSTNQHLVPVVKKEPSKQARKDKDRFSISS